MRLEPRDLALIHDIRKAAQEARGFIAKMSETTFLHDLRTQKAIEREFEIMGEAARALSIEARDQFPQIPFRSMIGMRNILAHAYGQVDPRELWKTVRISLPALLRDLPKF